MTFQEALKIAQEALNGIEIRCGRSFCEEGITRKHYTLRWQGLTHIANTGIRDFALYQDRIEEGKLVVGPAAYTRDGKTVEYHSEDIGLWKED